MDQEFKLPQEWFEEGKEWLARGEFLKARQAFEEALNLDPYYPQALCGLSRTYWYEGKYREAVEKINEALMIDRDDPEVIEHCANIFMAVGQKEDALDVLRAYLSRNPWDDDIKALMDRLQATPVSLPVRSSGPFESGKTQPTDTADFMVVEGEKQYEKGKTERARVCFEIALEHNPNHAKAHNNLGVILWESGDLKGALEHFQQAFREEPFDRDIVFNTYNALMTTGLPDVAKDLIRLYIQRNPFDEEAWELYDTVSSALSKVFWTGSGLSQEVEEVYTSMGKKLFKHGDLYGAAEAFHRALAINPENKKALKGLARIHKILGHLEEALNLYQELFEAWRDDEKIIVEYADCLVELGYHEKALSILEEFGGSEEVISRKIKEIREKMS
ncbi:MAG: tetratricopeptide repeat protein [Syntrophobacterales bacterium]|nr:tetratricopeptide repeat protein [Syntrophobacterales bacterium]